MRHARPRQSRTAFAASAVSILGVLILVATPGAAAAPTPTDQAFSQAALAVGYTQAEIKRIIAEGLENEVVISFEPVVDRSDAATPSSTSADTVVAPNKTAARQWAKSTHCYTYKGTAYGYNLIGNKVLSLSMEEYACVTKWSDVPGPTYRWHYAVTSSWSPGILTAHLDHHVFKIGTPAWSYEGLDDTGNYGPTITNGQVSVQRRGHFHASLGWGPISVTNHLYPWVKMEINSQGVARIYTGAHS